MQETIKDIINAHNWVVDHLETLKAEVSVFWGLELRHKLSIEAGRIVHLARGCNLNVVSDNDGRIIWK